MRQLVGSSGRVFGLGLSLVLLAVLRDRLSFADQRSSGTVLLVAYLAMLAIAVAFLDPSSLRSLSGALALPWNLNQVGLGAGILLASGLVVGWVGGGCAVLPRPPLGSLALVTGAAVVEELAVRGALWRLLRVSGSHVFAVLLVTTSVFVGMHLGTRTGVQLLPVAGFGLVLGLIRLLPGGLAGSIALHVTVNAGAVILAC